MMKRALIIDDDDVFRSNLAEALGQSLNNVAIVTAGSGKEAAKIIEDSGVDFIITDLTMPEMDGYDFISHMREKYSDIPIMVMTGAKTPAVEERLQALGVPLCIEKPFHIKEMVPMILTELKSGIRDDFGKSLNEFA